MIELTIHGRGGQGGVTLAKLIATAYFLRGRHTQAFGVYAAERSGAPLNAFVRIDNAEITNHNQVRAPDHVIVLDRTLIVPGVVANLKAGGWLILNSPSPPETLAAMFAGRRVATIDATTIALTHKLGTRSVPIVNTTMFGAVLKILGEPWEAVEAALADLKFGGANLEAAREAYERVCGEQLSGESGAEGEDGGHLFKAGATQRSAGATARSTAAARVADILDEDIGQPSPIRTGSWATRRPNRRNLLSPCAGACPAGNDIQAFVQALSEKKADEALAILLDTTPLPGICGRVCPAPCVDACNRRIFDEPVQIRELERYAADHGRRPQPTEPWRDERVAVVGSGPAGLSAAYHLALLGYEATLFEGGDELGGLLRTGIPAYRLPPNVLDAEIDYIIQHGVKVHTRCFIDRARLLEFSRAYEAVFVATGLQQVRSLELSGAHPDLVEEGIDFLDRVRRGDVSMAGCRVAVIGGGNTAMDAARSALRVGAKNVRILYRRTLAEMPAIREEIEEALEEGILLDELVAPLHLRVLGDEAMLTCRRMTLGPPDESGRRAPVPVTTEDSDFDVVCDRVILALGQSSDLSILPEGAEVKDRQQLLGLSGAPIFLGGDFATNEGTVAAAIGSGRRAAWHIHRTLTGEDLFPPIHRPVAGYDRMHMHVFTHEQARQSPHLSAAKRRRTFEEVRLGFDRRQSGQVAIEEAGRCMSCGVCNQCDRCVTYCPEGILRRNGDGYDFDYDYCKGCGICAGECPRGVIYMAEL